MRASVYRQEQFNSAHRLHNSKWSDAKNADIFGVCNNANYHGHNYQVQVKVTGEIDPETGYVIDLKWLSELIKTEIILTFDHKNLNLDTEEFKTLIPSAENIAFVIYTKLRSKIESIYDVQIRLYETKRNFVEFPA